MDFLIGWSVIGHLFVFHFWVSCLLLVIFIGILYVNRHRLMKLDYFILNYFNDLFYYLSMDNILSISINFLLLMILFMPLLLFITDGLFLVDMDSLLLILFIVIGYIIWLFYDNNSLLGRII